MSVTIEIRAREQDIAFAHAPLCVLNRYLDEFSYCRSDVVFEPPLLKQSFQAVPIRR